MKIHNLEQGTPEWFALRAMKMTASHATAIGNCGKGLDTYILELATEHYSSAERDDYSNREMDRGNELEPVARSIYELQTGLEVKEVGFIEMNEYVGCSPDGLIGEDGGAEFKAPKDTIYFETILKDKINSGYNWQVQMCLFITKRKWWDLVLYNPNFKESLIIKRIHPDPKKFEQIEAGIEIGIDKIKSIKSILQSKKNNI